MPGLIIRSEDKTVFFRVPCLKTTATPRLILIRGTQREHMMFADELEESGIVYIRGFDFCSHHFQKIVFSATNSKNTPNIFFKRSWGTFTAYLAPKYPPIKNAHAIIMA